MQGQIQSVKNHVIRVGMQFKRNTLWDIYEQSEHREAYGQHYLRIFIAVAMEKRRHNNHNSACNGVKKKVHRLTVAKFRQPLPTIEIFTIEEDSSAGARFSSTFEWLPTTMCRVISPSNRLASRYTCHKILRQAQDSGQAGKMLVCCANIRWA